VSTSIGHIQTNAGGGQAVSASGGLSVGSGRGAVAGPEGQQAVGDPPDPGIGAGSARDGRADLVQDPVQLTAGQRRPSGQDQHLDSPLSMVLREQLGALDQERAGGGGTAGGKLDDAAELR
jgi:hypothetical protein